MMEPFDRVIPKKDLATGIGTAVLVHVLIFGSALFWALLVPHKPLAVPYCSVDLVSVKDIGAGTAEPKGVPGASGKSVARRAHHAAAGHRRSEPVVPVRRLAVSEAKTHFEPPRIKQLQPKDVVVPPERTRGVESIDRNLEKLVARPKTKPHFSPPVARLSAREKALEARSAARRSEQVASSGAQSSDEDTEEEGGEAPGGSTNGRARGGRQGAGAGSAFGSPNGSAAITQVLGLYGQQVKEKIQSQWRLANDQGINGLMAVLEVQIRRSGEVVRVVVMKRSGNELFDAAAVRAVNMAAPLPPVPEAAAQGNPPNFILTFKPGKVS
ncbi:MAG: cell envelope integrity protein TolA [Syntrophobacteraceae bacterium]|nr:cell envelope integrity protein TolA [Syntrophobacteraceae bacterium]